MGGRLSSGGEHYQIDEHARDQCVSERAGPDVSKWSALDDHLQEKIIARLPFKSLFQALTLSKAWRLRFQSPTFASEVQSSSSSWKSYSPVLVSDKRELIGYERCSKRWHWLPTHTYLQSNVDRSRWSLRAAHGPLLCWSVPAGKNEIIYVANPLTRSFRELPRPHMQLPFEPSIHKDVSQGPFDIVHIVCEGKKAYSVILGSSVRLQEQTWIEIEILHSTNANWTVESYNTEVDFLSWGGSAIVEGVLYMLLYNNMGRNLYLISFGVNQKSWKKIAKLHNVQIFHEVLNSQLMVCGLDVMLVIGREVRGFTVHLLYSVFRLELKSGSVTELSRAPTELLPNLNPLSARASSQDELLPSLSFSAEASSQGDCIYIGGPKFINPCIVFDLGSKQWNRIPSPGESLGTGLSFVENECYPSWTSISYEPGLCPFFEV